MKYHVYRFLDVDDNILYIGKTNDIDFRMREHFNNGHLEILQYESIDKIEYLELESESDQVISEIYLINKYDPIYNKQNKKSDRLNLELNLIENWKNLNNINKYINPVEVKVKSKNINPGTVLYNLKMEMFKISLSQVELAELLGITKQAVNYKINGVNEFKLSEIDLIQKTYFKDLEIEYLFKREV